MHQPTIEDAETSTIQNTSHLLPKRQLVDQGVGLMSDYTFCFIVQVTVRPSGSTAISVPASQVIPSAHLASASGQTVQTKSGSPSQVCV